MPRPPARSEARGVRPLLVGVVARAGIRAPVCGSGVGSGTARDLLVQRPPDHCSQDAPSQHCWGKPLELEEGRRQGAGAGSKEDRGIECQGEGLAAARVGALAHAPGQLEKRTLRGKLAAHGLPAAGPSVRRPCGIRIGRGWAATRQWRLRVDAQQLQSAPLWLQRSREALRQRGRGLGRHGRRHEHAVQGRERRELQEDRCKQHELQCQAQTQRQRSGARCSSAVQAVEGTPEEEAVVHKHRRARVRCGSTCSGTCTASCTRADSFTLIAFDG
mmetsp:Transcript_696/g.2285  ORF Transcript_696/g.2285 Transcript_696/m.2285 type:complete len:274 (-) Transcript_696:88-909(-)